jgi:type I restriction enzyme S subunit
MAELQETTLAEVSKDIAYGYTESANVDAVGPKFLRITDIQGGIVNWHTVPHCPISPQDHDKYRLCPGDLVVARTGNSTGENFIFCGGADAVFASYLIRFRLDASRVNSRFVWYNLRTRRWWDFIASSKTGSAQAGANAKVLGRFPLKLPTLGEQEAIAEVLGSLDDKIEQNRRTGSKLEGLARAVFKAWFVDFEPVKAKAAGATAFPGMPPETFAALPTAFNSSELGPIPKCWKVGKFGDLINIHDSRRIPLSKKQRDERRGTFRYYGAAGIVDFVDDFLFDGIYILTGEDGTVSNDDGTPVTQYVWGKFWVNNHAHVLTAKPPFTNEHLLLVLQSLQVKPFVTGAVQPKLSQGNMKSIPLVMPPDELAQPFGVVIEPLFALVRSFADESAKLAAIRDYLLPRLLSGRVRVADAETSLAAMESPQRVQR